MFTYAKSTFVGLAVLTTGCQTFGVFAKRESELCCPTDVRQTIPWCAGEDAVFDYPCGPAEEFYGHKPTCWRTWPTPGAIWRDTYCPSPASFEAPVPEALPPVKTAPLPSPDAVRPGQNTEDERPSAPPSTPPRLQVPPLPDDAARAKSPSPPNPFRLSPADLPLSRAGQASSQTTGRSGGDDQTLRLVRPSTGSAANRR